MLTKWEAMAAILATAALIGSAMGQIAPPPGPAAEVTRAPPKRVVEDPFHGDKPPPDPDAIGIARLWRDKDNKLEELTEPLYWASLKKNALVTPKVAEELSTYRRLRERQYERIVVENIDLMREVLEGAIEKVNDAPRNPQDRDGRLGKLLQLLKPLVGDSIREAIKQRGLLTRSQLDHQDKIKRAYTEERGRDIEAAKPVKDAALKERMRLQLHDFIDESTWAYAGLLNDVAANWEVALAKADLDEAIKKELSTAFADVKAAKDDKGRVAAMKKLVLLITPGQERELLRAAVEVRPAKP